MDMNMKIGFDREIGIGIGIPTQAAKVKDQEGLANIVICGHFSAKTGGTCQQRIPRIIRFVGFASKAMRNM